MNSPDFSPSNLRKNVLRMASDKAGHIACAFSLIEIVSTLFEQKILKYNQENPSDPDRDILALSKGHGAMALYACFYELGWLSDHDLDNYFLDGSELFGLMEEHTPGAEISGGSLGHGLAVAVGIAYGYKKKGINKKVFCIVGDGELNEGSIWEALLFAGHHKLENLTIIVDANKYQAMGRTEEVLDLDPLGDKFRSFKFSYQECNGHNVEELKNNLIACCDSKQPAVLVARTIKGGGVDFMEQDNCWHYTRLTDPDLRKKALEQVQSNRTPGEKQ
ncbi:MAG: transketolase [Bacteriovoracaceae bacterium]|nr:transketolase [Bacteriovoracaceae bacterium]